MLLAFGGEYSLPSNKVDVCPLIILLLFALYDFFLSLVICLLSSSKSTHYALVALDHATFLGQIHLHLALFPNLSAPYGLRHLLYLSLSLLYSTLLLEMVSRD